MSDIIRCLNPSAAFRDELNTGSRGTTLTFEDPDGTIAFVGVTVRAVRTTAEGRERVITAFPSGHFVSLLLPAATDDAGEIIVERPSYVIDLINDAGKPCEETLQWEQYLRWQEMHILWGTADSADCGPYGQHPVLGEYPRSIREQLAAQLATGKKIGSIKLLREHSPGLGLLEAKVFIDTLVRFY